MIEEGTAQKEKGQDQGPILRECEEKDPTMKTKEPKEKYVLKAAERFALEKKYIWRSWEEATAWTVS